MSLVRRSRRRTIRRAVLVQAAQAQGGSFAATSDAVPGAVFVLLMTGIAAAIVVVAGTLKRRA